METYQAMADLLFITMCLTCVVGFVATIMIAWFRR